jgi:hypothetical protein
MLLTIVYKMGVRKGKQPIAPKVEQ